MANPRLMAASVEIPDASRSIARIWNEATLYAIRGDYARPTVTARNLYHLSLALHDAWAIYDERTPNVFINFKAKPTNLEKNRVEAMSYAAFRVLNSRYANAPKKTEIFTHFSQIMTTLGLDPSNDSTDPATPAGAGNLVGQMILDNASYDGALESEDYRTPADQYGPTNPPMIVKMTGAGKIIDVNVWQPLALDLFVDQAGFAQPTNVAPPLTLHWGRLKPFALTEKERSRAGLPVYLDPGPPPRFGGPDHDVFRKSMEQVIEFSSWLDPRDNEKVDISPRSIGNNTLGKNDGSGHELNPKTGLEYQPQLVLRGDFARVLAEFWADGPNSETPPGHWNTIANYVSSRPGFRRKWMGQGPELSKLEWDVKMYLTLNGALYDASIAAWALKGYYMGSRPISAIRHMAELGQSSDPKLPKYHPLGLKLRPGLIELITPELTQPGERFAHLVGHEGEIAVRSWAGAPANPANEFKGVGWILGANWLPYQRPTFVTPPFPGYVSGHSTFSRAAAEVLTSITGDKYFPGGMGEFVAKKNQYLVFEDGPSQTIRLQWATYYDAADQCSMSRIYGGIHGDIDDFPGRKIGSYIGKKAVARMNSLR